MTDIRIYDFNFNLLCIMSDTISSSWSIKYNGIGTYEGHFCLNSKISDIILNNTYIILTQGKKQAVCTGKIADKELLVCGRTLNWLLEKRVMPPFKTREIFGESYQDTKTIIDYILTKTFIAPPQLDNNGLYIENTIDSRKIVDNFIILPYSDTFQLQRHFWRINANTVHEIIYDLTEMMDVAYKLNFNISNKSWDFEIINGVEKKFIISEQNKNFYDVSYTEDVENYASGGWYETSSQNIDSSSETTTEQESIWNYIRTNDDTSGMQYWESVLGGVGVSEAQSSLEAKKKNYTIQGTMSKLKYEKDYNLGDIVTIYIKLGNFSKKMKYKITGVNLWQTEFGSGEEPIFKQIKEV